MVSSIRKNFRDELKNFLENPNLSDLEKTLHRVELDTVLELFNAGNKQAFQEFLTNNAKYFPTSANNFEEISKSNFEIAFYKNRWKLCEFFNPLSLFYSFLSLMFLFVIIWIISLNPIRFEFFINPYQIFIFIIIIFFFLWIIYTNYYFFSKEKSAISREKFLFLAEKVNNFILNFASFYFVFGCFLFTLFLVFILNFLNSYGISFLFNRNFMLFLVYLIISAPVNALLFICIYFLAFYQRYASKNYLYYKFRFLNSVIYSKENNINTIPYYFLKFLEEFNRKINKTLNLKIENIDLIIKGIYRRIIINDLSLIEEFALSLKNYMLESKRNEISKYLNFNHSMIKEIINLLEVTFEESDIPKFTFDTFTYADSIKKYRKIIFFILSSIVTILASFIPILVFNSF